MKRKKLTALLTAIAVISTFTVMQVYADTTNGNSSASSSISDTTADKTKDSKKNEENLKAALTKVKERIEIPAEYSVFKYSNNTYYGENSFNFTWSDSTGNSIVVTITGDVITNYYTYGNNYGSRTNTKASFAKLSDKELQKKAEEMAKQLNPSIFEKQEIKLDNISLLGNNASFSISRKENGIDVYSNSGSIDINKDTGELISYYLSWWNNAEFADPGSAKTEKEIEECYKKLNTLTPKYKIIHDSETNTDKAILVYVPDFTSEIDAFTGEKSTIWDDYSKSMDTSNYGNSTAGDKGAGTEEIVQDEESIEKEVTFTEEEKKAIEKNKNLLTKEKIIEIIKADKYINLTKDYLLSSASLNEDYANSEKYIWTVSYSVNTKKEYKYLYVNLDAETGKILNFSKYKGTYDDSKAEKKSINVTKANSLATEAAKYYLPDIFDEYKADKKNTEKSASTKNYTEQSRTFIFTRYANDIQVESDYINIEVNSDNEVMGFNYDYHDVDFPSNKMVSVDYAYSMLFKQKDFNYYYNGFTTLDGKSKTYLIYNMDYFYMNAKNGKLVDSEGNEITETSEGNGYTDVSGHWAEKYINKLADYGLTLSSDNGKFNPDNAITEEEFQSLLDQIFSSYTIYYGYDVVEDAREENTESKSEPVKKTSITKAEAAKMFVTSMGGSDYANLKGIYKVPFKDVPASREDIGYIAIAYANNFAYVDSKGNFNPDSKVTRGMAMYLIYRYLSN
jgi:hypothetical protein